MPIRKGILALVAVGCVTGPVFAAPPTRLDAAQALARDGQKAYRDRQYEQAAEFYDKALRQFEHEDILFMLGRSLEQAGQYLGAALAYERATEKSRAADVRLMMNTRSRALRLVNDGIKQLQIGNAGALDQLRDARRQLLVQARRAEDGKVYPEPAGFLLTLAAAELTVGDPGVGRQLAEGVESDPTGADDVRQRATALLSRLRAQASQRPTPVPSAIGVAAPAPHERPPTPAAVAVVAEPAASVHAAAAHDTSVVPWVVMGLGLATVAAGAGFAQQSQNTWGAIEALPDVAERADCPAGATCKPVTWTDAATYAEQAQSQARLAWICYGVGGAVAAGGLVGWVVKRVRRPGSPASVLTATRDGFAVAWEF